MTPKEIVLSGYQAFSEGNLPRLSEIFHKNAVIQINGDHKYSRDYQGFEDWRDNFLVHLPSNYPNFDLEILYMVAEGDRVHVHVKYTADNLDAKAVHMFVVKDGLQTEFLLFEDSQKISVALERVLEKDLKDSSTRSYQ